MFTSKENPVSRWGLHASLLSIVSIVILVAPQDGKSAIRNVSPKIGSNSAYAELMKGNIPQSEPVHATPPFIGPLKPTLQVESMCLGVVEDPLGTVSFESMQIIRGMNLSPELDKLSLIVNDISARVKEVRTVNRVDMLTGGIRIVGRAGHYYGLGIEVNKKMLDYRNYLTQECPSDIANRKKKITVKP